MRLTDTAVQVSGRQAANGSWSSRRARPEPERLHPDFAMRRAAEARAHA